MHSYLFKITIVPVLMFLSVNSHAQAGQKEDITIKLTNPAKPFSLNIGLIEGSITVMTHAGKDLLVEAQRSSKKTPIQHPDNQNSNSNSNSNSNRNIDSIGLPRQAPITTISGRYIKVVEKDNEVRIGPVSVSSSLDIVIKLPQNSARLNLSVAQNGEVSVKGVNGEIEVLNSNGPVRLTDVSGSVTATTITGDITVTFVSVKETSPMAFSSLLGKIDVTFPSSFKANMNLQSDGGRLYSDYDIQLDATGQKMEKRNTTPLYTTRLEGKLTGKINGGGADILMKNMNGNMYIRKSK